MPEISAATIHHKENNKPVTEALAKAANADNAKDSLNLLKTIIKLEKDDQPQVNNEIKNLEAKLGIEKKIIPAERLIVKNAYYLQKEKTIMDLAGGGFISGHRDTLHEKDPKKTLSEKAKSIFQKSKIKKFRPQDGEDFYKVFSQSYVLSEVLDNQCLNNLQDLSSSEIKLGLERMDKLGFYYKNYLSKPEVKQAIKEISSIPEENFNSASSELNPYFFLKNADFSDQRIFDSQTNKINPFFNTLLEITKKGHIDPETKNRLNVIKEAFLLQSEDTSFRYRYLNGIENIKISSLDNNIKSSIIDIFNPNQELKLKLGDYKGIDQKIFNSNFKFIYENLDSFGGQKNFFKVISKEQINQIPISDNGSAVFLKTICDAKDNYQDEKIVNNIIDYVIKNKDKVTSSFKSYHNQVSNFILELAQSDTSNSSFIDDLRAIKIYDTIKPLINEEYDNDYWSLVFNTTNSDFAKSLIIEKDKFFDYGNYPKPFLLETILKNPEENNSTVKNLCDKFCLKENVARFSPKDKLIWSIYTNMDLPWDKKEYFISNLDQFSQLVGTDDKINPAIFEKIIQDYGQIVLLSELTLSDEILSTLPPQDKTFWNLYKDIVSSPSSDWVKRNEQGLKLLEVRQNFLQSLNTNSFNLEFFTNVATNFYNNKNVINEYFNDENISKLSSDRDKSFLIAFKNNPNDHIAYNMNLFSKLINTDGFKQEALDKILTDISKNNFYFGQIIRDCSNKTDTIFTHISIPDKVFLQTLSRLIDRVPLQDKDKLLPFMNKNHPNFSEFVDKNGNLNNLFLESLSKETTLYLGNDYFIKQIITNLPEKDKMLWNRIKETEDCIFANLIIENKNNPEFFNENMVPTSKFYEEAFKDGEYHKIPEDILKTFSQADQNFWNLFNQFDFKFPKVIEVCIENKNNPEFFNKNMVPTSKLYEAISKNGNFSIISPDVLKTFSQADQTFWKNFGEKPSSFLTKFIIEKKGNLEFFTKDGVALSKLYETAFKDGNFSLISKDVLKTFSETDQNFWKNFGEKPTSSLVQHSIQDKNNPEYFKNGIALSKLYETSFKFGGFSPIPKDVLKTFSETDQNFWSAHKDILDFGFSNEINRFLIENKSDISKFLDKDNKPNSLLFESVFKQKIGIPEILFSDEKLAHFSDQDKRMWQLIHKLSNKEINTFIIDNKNQINNIFKNQKVASFLNLDKNSDMQASKLFNKLSNEDYFIIKDYELKNIIDLLDNNEVEINENNWGSLLMLYVKSQQEEGYISPDIKKKIDTIFDDSKAKNLCLQEMQNSWKFYLTRPEEMPISLKILSKYIDRVEGVGPLSQIESLSLLINSVDKSLTKDTTAPRTKTEMLTGLSEIEERFTINRWSNEDKTNFYNISKDVIDAAPSLFSDYLTLFKKLSPSELKSFSEEIYPLYKTKLVLIEKENEIGNKYYKNNELLDLRKDIRGFTDFNLQKEKLLTDIKQLFSTRFEITKIPENFTPENIRSIKNMSMFLSNISNRTSDKEAILGFYLSLTINGRWDDFRNGKEINPSEYMSENKNKIIKPFLQERQELMSAITKNTGIQPENIPEFIQLLQSETQNVRIGDIETVDIKLNNIINNLDELQDLDLYPEPLDKQRMELLQTWGNKEVGSTAAKLYQQLSNPAKNISLSENETKIKQKITEICQETGLDINNPQIIKENFQDGIKSFSTLVNISSSIKKLNVQGEIEALKTDLEPSPEIIEIFTRLGEDFKVSSGAIALSQDLDYLDNLVIKKEELINPEEKTILSDYISTIKTQVLKLEGVYEEIKNKFENLKQGSSSSPNILLNQKLKEIEAVINNQSTQQVITSAATNNLNTITENIRECLSCKRKGCNNDTDLTFGDINKFYLYSKSENQIKGSISDQLAYFEPIIRADGSTEASFIIDKSYGTRTPSILENQLETIIKKNRIIKQKFPNSKVSVFVSNTALSSCGALSETLIKNLKDEKIFAQKETIEVDIIKSAAADHYIEIGGGARTSGKRNVSGIIINI